eukprot:1323084-Amphidinium_carterae.1
MLHDVSGGVKNRYSVKRLGCPHLIHLLSLLMTLLCHQVRFRCADDGNELLQFLFIPWEHYGSNSDVPLDSKGRKIAITTIAASPKTFITVWATQCARV